MKHVYDKTIHYASLVVVEAVAAVRSSSSSANFRKVSDGHHIPYSDLKELA